MLNQKQLALFFFISLLNACTVTGPADDGFEKDNEWVDNGRLGGGMIIFSSKQKQANSIVLDEKTEFEQYKRWNKLRTEDKESAEYQEFLQWLSYQEFKAGQ